MEVRTVWAPTSGAGPLHRTLSDLDDQNSSYLDQAVPLRVKELEDLLEVLHLVLGEPLGLLRHDGEVVGRCLGRWVLTCLSGRALARTGRDRPTAPHTAPQPLPPLSYVRHHIGISRSQEERRSKTRPPRASDSAADEILSSALFFCEHPVSGVIRVETGLTGGALVPR